MTEASVRVLHTAEEWDRIEGEWRALHAACPLGQPPQRWDWLREWWRLYGPAYSTPDGLRILTVWEGEQLAGALPFYLRRAEHPYAPRRLCLLSTGEAEVEETCPDYLDLLARPGAAEICLRAMKGALEGPETQPWDEIECPGLAEDSPLHGWATGLENGARAVSTPLGECVMADLSAGFDGYLSTRSSNFRSQGRRLLRSVEKEGLRFDVAATESEVDEFYRQLVELHQARWTAVGRPGCFSAERFTRLHHTLARRGLETGEALLCRLARANGEAVGVVYGFPAGNRFQFYQCGIGARRVGHLESPGVALQLLLMRWVAEERGIQEYDFLRGSAAYKERFASRTRALLRLSVTRPTARHYAGGAWSLATRGGRKLARILAARRGGAASTPAPENTTERPPVEVGS